MAGEGHRTGGQMDYITLLPPRKRLLAGLKKQGCDQDCSPSLPINSVGLQARIQELLNLSNPSLEKAIQASKSAALAAAEAATVARTAAIEKATTAAKAKAFANSVLELVGSVSTGDACKESGSEKMNEGEKKYMEVELFFKSSCSIGSCEADEEMARRLHQDMNSSPRISRKRNKKYAALVKTGGDDGVIVCDKDSFLFSDGDLMVGNLNSLLKAGKEILEDSKDNRLEKERSSSYSSEKSQSGFEGKVVVPGKRRRIKQKTLLLSQCGSARDCKDARVIEGPKSVAFSGESTKKVHGTGKSPMFDAKPYDGCGISSTKADSTWKCKKLKLSHSYSERKILQPLCSKSTVASTSALVKVD